MDRLDQPLPSSTPGPRRSGAASRNSPYNRSSKISAADGTGSWKHDRNQDDAGARRGPRNGSSRAPMFFPPDKSQVNEVKPTGKLTIENLHWDVSEQDLEDLFGSIGPVSRAYIKYDRADRSTGVAVIVYDNPNHALQAKNEFDGAKAKGQVISITQEMRADRPRGGPVAQRSLMSRFDLSSRLKDGVQAQGAAATNSFADRLGPVRNGAGRGAQREANRSAAGQQQQARSRNAPAKREKRTPVTAADLDAELEAFMNAPSKSQTATRAAVASETQPPQATAADVDMS